MDRSSWSKSSEAAPSAARGAEAEARFALDGHVFYWFTQVVALRDRQLAQSLRAHDLRVPEWRVLASLSAEGRLTMGALAELASIDRTTLTRTVDRMTRAGLIGRRRDAADRRIMRLALTVAGRRTFQRLRPIAVATNEAAMAGLDAKARAMLMATLRRMRANLAADAATEMTDATEGGRE